MTHHRILFFGGKGGVGKTTCASAVAFAASREGRRVLLVSTDPAHSTSDIFERPFSAEERQVLPGLTGLEVNAESEARRYLDDVRAQVSRLFSPAVLNEASRQMELASSMPGFTEVAVFDRLCRIVLDRAASYDLMVFDTAPTGHTLRLLRMPELMATWIGALAERRRVWLHEEQAIAREDGARAPRRDPIMSALEERARRLEAVRARLTDPRVSAFVLVLTPERLPIEETERALAALRDAGMLVTTLVVNRVLPDDLEGEFYRSRRSQEQQYRDEIDRRFSGWPRVVIPQLLSDVHGLDPLARIAAHLLPH